MSSLLQKLQQAAKNSKLPAAKTTVTTTPTASGGTPDAVRWNPVKAGCVCGFIVLLVIAAVLIINRLHEQSHNCNLIRIHDEDWKDLDVGDGNDDQGKVDQDPNFTPLADLIGKM